MHSLTFTDHIKIDGVTENPKIRSTRLNRSHDAPNHSGRDLIKTLSDMCTDGIKQAQQIYNYCYI